MATVQGAWTCTAEGLNYTGINEEGANERLHRPISVAKSEAGNTDINPTAFDNPDTWCENGTTCRQNDGPYRSQAKGNAAYGIGGDVIGAVDFIVRVTMNGRQPRYVLFVYNDYGPAISPYLSLTCREENTGPDGYCGESGRTPGWIASSWQSSVIYGNRLQDASSYHADLGGDFRATGYGSQTWWIATLTTNSWICPTNDGNCYFP
ncbi:hypothetical protein [Allostreptomyces psammosilenae]|uniref:Uncharacterized protein n=1 Tax=Allostreptomyces psammosilenae TaxID=1892865 RepID=A0A852ZZP1_9ACTN|nr:hypothetical protein [Allostreptomyces psammosilenae]NYI07806.1 hypothetical protein [Allostreptomyces psammosilenae]